MLSCEALATKAEVQELRNQINTLLGKKEDGSVQDVLTQGNLGIDTILGESVALASTAMQDIELVDESDTAYNLAGVENGVTVAAAGASSVIWEELKTGKAKWVKVFKNGDKAKIEGLTKVAQGELLKQLPKQQPLRQGQQPS
jgi:hypothetical protein